MYMKKICFKNCLKGQTCVKNVRKKTMTTRTSYDRMHKFLLTPWKTNCHIGNKSLCKSKEVTRTHQKNNFATLHECCW